MAENLAIAQAVLRDVRETYYKSPNFKSSNKLRTKVESDIESKRLNAAHLSIANSRTNSSRAMGGIKAAKGHNCGELSRLAADILLKRNVRAVQILIGNLSFTHAFAAILPNGCLDRKSWANDMDQWDEGIIICDPWSNIACSAREFNRSFIEKLDKWYQDGKMLFMDGCWVDANNERLRNSIVTGEKRTCFVPSPPSVVGFDIK